MEENEGKKVQRSTIAVDSPGSTVELNIPQREGRPKERKPPVFSFNSRSSSFHSRNSSRERNHDDNSESPFELDSEIERITADADAILESIRKEATRGSSLERREQRRAKAEALTTDIEDDDMLEELAQLESIAASIRESLNEKPGEIPSPMAESSSSHDEPFTLAKEEEFQSPNLEKDKQQEAMGVTETLILGVTIVWAIVIVLLVHAKYYLLDEQGMLRLPLQHLFS